MENQPKISTVEIVFITPWYILSDIVGVILGFAGMDDFFLMDIIRFPISQFYLKIKGVSGTATLVSNILETIPYIGDLPIATLGWLITIWLDRHPEIGKKLQSTTPIPK